MVLKQEIDEKRQAIKTDSYAVSIGELISMYRAGELDIHPEFQRFYRWTPEQKSRLIESILLGIPVPSIFVQQREDGIWDVIDGLQRLSTIFELTGDLVDEAGVKKPQLILNETKYLPSLLGKRWGDDDDPNYLDKEQQLLIKRSKLDVTIILRESDETSKFELFQRLNTGGSPLSDQEVRNCIMIMLNRDLYQWISKLNGDNNFRDCVALSDKAIDEQYDMELVVRFLLFRTIPEKNLNRIGDIGDFLTDGIEKSAMFDETYFVQEEKAFRYTFELLANTLGENSFSRYSHEKSKFIGGFLVSAFEAVALGLGANYELYYDGATVPDIEDKVKEIWQDPVFLKGIGSGVSASRRVPITIPLGRQYFQK